MSASSGVASIFSKVFGSIGQSLGEQTAQAADSATQAFYIIAGELAVIIVLLIGIFIKQR